MDDFKLDNNLNVYNIYTIVKLYATSHLDKIQNILWTKRLYNKLVKLANKPSKYKLNRWLNHIVDLYSTKPDNQNNKNNNIDNISILDFLKEINK